MPGGRKSHVPATAAHERAGFDSHVDQGQAQLLHGHHRESLRDGDVGKETLEQFRPRVRELIDADSDEAAQAFRFDGARYSDMMSPRAWSLAGW